ncbi:hypothetical protein LAZ67_10002354 [Cordylochernes scorpioides]|uniref:Uncharacterized protein n=1 Tax=Cordylochernes scorpioides TaxID=51811 RepID=A0ABY6KWL9_9ARAC|nr:hypothetical protein LAZ67_10002354 [Cordylochernes scorpioides]
MLGVTTDRCADILYLVVESCLPQDVLISWQRSSQSEDLESLMKLLRREVNQTKDREMAYNKHSDSLAQPTPGKIEMKKRSFNARREIATTSGFMHSDISPTMHEKLKCIFCHNYHPSQDCQKGMKMGMDEKNDKIKNDKRCFKCLLPGQRSRQCKRKVRFDFCKRDGHYAIIMLITSLMTQEIKVSDLWSLENIGVMDDRQADSKKETDQAIMDKFWTETKQLESGRYEVHLPWIEPAQKLKENKSHAEKRLWKMTEDLKKRGFYHHYNKLFEE